MAKATTFEAILEQYVDIAHDLGQGFAEVFFTNSPPPWTEAEYHEAIERLNRMAMQPFQERPEWCTDHFLELMKLSAFDGFEERLRAILLTAQTTQGGHA